MATLNFINTNKYINNSNNNNNNNNGIINFIFNYPTEINKIIESIDTMIQVFPMLKELPLAKQVVTDTRERSKFDEKIDTIKKNANKDFNDFTKSYNSQNQSPNNNNNFIILLNKYIKFRVLIEFNNSYQRKCIKDYFGPFPESKVPLLLALNDLSAFHNSAPLGFNDLVYRDYTDRYTKMFCDFHFKNPKTDESIQIPVFKLGNQENISSEILSSIIEFKQYIKDNIKPLPQLQCREQLTPAQNNNNNNNNNQQQSPTLSPLIASTTFTSTSTSTSNSTLSDVDNNSIIKFIFKSPEINDIVNSVNQMIKVNSNLKNELTQIKDLMNSKEGLKATSIKIETIKRNAIKYIKEETELKDKKSIIKSDLFNKYIQLRVMVEFSFMYQRKQLREQPDHRAQIPSIQSKRMNDLSIFHNSFPMYIYDLVKRDYSSNKFQRISRNFTFTLNSQQITIPTFKLPQEDISDIIQNQFNQVYQLIQIYKKNKKHPYNSSNFNNNHININNNNSNNNKVKSPPFIVKNICEQQTYSFDHKYLTFGSDEEDEDDSKYYEERINNFYNECEDDEDDEDQNYIEQNSISLSNSLNTNSSINNSIPINSNSCNNNNNKNNNLIIEILNQVFESPEVIKITNTLNEMIELYPQFNNSLVFAKDIVLGNEGNKGLDVKIEIIRKNALKDIQEEMGYLDQILFNKYITFRLLVEFSWMHQRRCLRDFINSHTQRDKIQGVTISKLFNDLSTFHNKIPLFFYDLVNRDYSKFDMAKEYQFKLDQSNDNEQVTIPLFKLSPTEGDISTVIHSIFNEIQTLSNSIKYSKKYSNSKSKINNLNSLKENDSLLNLFKQLFDYSNFNKNEDFFSTLFNLKKQYPKYSVDIKSIKDQALNKNCKGDFYDLLKRSQLIRQKIQKDIDEVMPNIRSIRDDTSRPLIYNELLNRISLYHFIIEYAHFNQKFQLRESLEQIKSSPEAIHEIVERLKGLHQNATMDLYKFEHLLVDRLQLEKYFYQESTYTLIDGKKVTLKLMEFSNEPITTFILYFFKQAQEYIHGLKIGILKTIFKSLDQNSINFQINEMMRLFPKYINSLIVIKETVASNQKEIESIIEVLKKPLSVTSTLSFDIKPKLSILHPLYSSFRLLLEFNHAYQRKCLKELIGDKIDKKQLLSKLLIQLDSFHNSLSFEFNDIIKKDYDGHTKDILKPFEFSLNGKKQIPIPYFKLSTVEDLSNIIKELLNEIINTVYDTSAIKSNIKSESNQSYNNNNNNSKKLNEDEHPQPKSSGNSYASIVSSPLLQPQYTPSSIPSPPLLNQHQYQIQNQNQDQHQNHQDHQDHQDQDQHQHQQLKNKSNCSTNNSMVDVVGVILKFIFDYSNFGDEEKIFSALMEMRTKYVKYRGSLLDIRENFIYDKDYFRGLKERVDIVKRNIEEQLTHHLKSNGKDSNSIMEFKPIFKLFMSFRVLVEYNNFYQRIQIKERLDNIDSSASPETYNLAIKILHDLTKMHYQDTGNEVVQLLNGTLFNSPIFDAEFHYSLDSTKQLTSREFKFGGEPISSYYKLFSNQTLNLLMNETNGQYFTETKDKVSNENDGSGNHFIPDKQTDSVCSNNVCVEQQISPSKISATREENEKLLEEIRKLQEDINNLKMQHQNQDHQDNEEDQPLPTSFQQPDITNNSNNQNILKQIFQSISDTNGLHESINQMIYLYPQYASSLNLMKDLLNSTNFNIKIDTIKMNAIREFKLLIKLNNNNGFDDTDEQSITSDILFNLYVSFRVMFEFSYIHQKKLLETYISNNSLYFRNNGIQDDQLLQKITYQLMVFHNSQPVQLKDLIQREYSCQVVKEFYFNFNGQVVVSDNDDGSSLFSIQTFKLFSDNNLNHLSNNDDDDISIVTKQLLFEIQSLSKSYNIIDNNNNNINNN
ncbi:hypothetical protein DICPUDRAFT_98522 [Dictyostelium purpureum]|uniref:Uncharacterized protein n=1 Tax=Dictyostelium purpureum TaxID=5786 RepID=F0ZR66_DICPU|nr:uncharacterized protein DICPUDRAFT_98522 [Dictyostelium purpureum]EGC33558.1 hypothetical protein DICPUDRAFT_98522 [Dictyostelium purpureum]|eukprot:XP_003289907.1 hypothetical protein DICPUDRAFT_98522 [Dictyostelium purpureum]